MDARRSSSSLFVISVLLSVLVRNSQSQKVVLTIGGGVAAGTGVYTRLGAYDVPRRRRAAGGPLCARQPSVAPGTSLAASLDMPSVNLACVGSSIDNVREQWEYAQSTLSNSTVSDWTGSTIIISMGLDDVTTQNERWSWRGLLNWCELEPIPMLYECHYDEGNQMGNLDVIQLQLSALVSRIADEASGARIRVLGYGRIYQPPPYGSGCQSIGMNNPESRFLDNMVDEINLALLGAVSLARDSDAVDIKFVDMNDYLTVGNCAGLFAEERHMRGIVLGWFLIMPTVSVASYHPTKLGYEAYDQALMDSL